MAAQDEPAIKNVMAFFDGQNLFQHAKEAFGHHHPNYDPAKLHKAVCAANNWRATLTRFYTGVPTAIESPMWAAYWSNRVLALKRAGVVVTTRQPRYRREQLFDGNGDPILEPDGKPKIITTPQEKGIDVRLALDLVSLARKKQFDIALVFSQDQDLQEVVHEIADISKEQDRWIRVACAFPSGGNASSGRGIDKVDWFRMDQTFYDACLDPRDYRPKRA
ncbi:NYN domain-containing protein [Bradyrhizobium sp. 26S5]|uniref:NYN domain-containing protein n=1 Tax=Bradyrhizobium sp. 26S5 TaxID=3139729 RepID=UPI0030CB8DB2